MYLEIKAEIDGQNWLKNLIKLCAFKSLIRNELWSVFYSAKSPNVPIELFATEALYSTP